VPASPWRTFGSPDSNGDFVALLSYLLLKSHWSVPPFFLYTAQVVEQLASAQGLLGYSVRARPFSKRFWTLCMEGRSGVAGLRAASAARAPDGRSCSPYGQDEVRTMGRQGFSNPLAVGRCVAPIR